jgi:hypothetical protein
MRWRGGEIGTGGQRARTGPETTRVQGWSRSGVFYDVVHLLKPYTTCQVLEWRSGEAPMCGAGFQVGR